MTFHFAPLKATVDRWLADFKCNRINTDDPESSSQPIDAVTPENVRKLYKIIWANRKVKLNEPVDALEISKTGIAMLEKN